MQRSAVRLIAAILGARLLAAQETQTTSPVETLIPWLLREDGELKGVAFPDVIRAATGKK